MRKVSTFCLEKAAQAWQGDKTSSKVMDSELAIEFAIILDGVWSQPWLGNATTEELLEELKARLGSDILNWIPEDKLQYKTVQEGDLRMTEVE